MNNIYVYKSFLITFVFVLMYLVFNETIRTNFGAHLSLKLFNSKKISEELYPLPCYLPGAPTSARKIPEITDMQPKPGRSIFFIESSCSSMESNKVTLTPRQVCAIESAARSTPSYDVYLLVLSTSNLGGTDDQNDRTLAALEQYPNIRIAHLDFVEYMNNTPLQNLLESGEMKYSQWPVHHVSDVLRYLTLWKFGGVYMDLDVMIKEDFSKVTAVSESFTGLETSDSLGAGIIGFGIDEIGRKWVESCLEDLDKNYEPNQWSTNANGVVSRLLRKICPETNHVIEMNKAKCGGFQVHEQNDFYPISYNEWQKLFNPNHTEEVLDRSKNSKALHFWNKLTSKTVIKLNDNSSTAYEVFASKYCPNVFKSCTTVF